MTEYPYSLSHPAWDKVRVQVSDLGPRLDMPQFSRKFRSARPRLLLYDLPPLNWRGFIACAPLNTVFAAIDVFGRILSHPLIHWAEEIAENATVYEQFEAVIRKGGIKKDEVPKTLFWPYASFGAYVNGTKRSFGTKSPRMDYLQVSGWIFDVEKADRFEELLEQVISAAGEWGFCHAAEDVKNSRKMPEGKKGILSLLSAPLLVQNEEAPSRESRLANLSLELSFATAQLRATKEDVFFAPPSEVVRPRLDLFVNASGFGMESSFDDKTEEVVIKKIAFAQELGWPTFYSALSDSLSCCERAECSRYDQLKDALRKALDTLRAKHGWVGSVEQFAREGF